MTVCNFHYANVNGFKPKADSIKQLLAENNVDLLLLNESKVYSSKAKNIKVYQSFHAVREDREEVFSLDHSCTSMFFQAVGYLSSSPKSAKFNTLEEVAEEELASQV